MLRAIEERLARIEAPLVAWRRDLGACAAIGAGCRAAVEAEGRVLADAGPTRIAIVRLGEEAAERLAAIPVSAALRAADAEFLARHPPRPNAGRTPIVQQMARLVARWREESGIDRIDAELALAEVYLRVTGQRRDGT